MRKVAFLRREGREGQGFTLCSRLGLALCAHPAPQRGARISTKRCWPQKHHYPLIALVLSVTFAWHCELVSCSMALWEKNKPVCLSFVRVCSARAADQEQGKLFGGCCCQQVSPAHSLTAFDLSGGKTPRTCCAGIKRWVFGPQEFLKMPQSPQINPNTLFPAAQEVHRMHTITSTGSIHFDN